MTVATREVTVATSATRLDTAPDPTVTVDKRSILFYNNGAVTIYVGPSTVTTGTAATAGVPVAAGAWSPAFELNSGESLYGIVATGTCTCRVLQTGL